MVNVRYRGPARETTWRKVAVASWNPSGDPTIYGSLDLRAELMLSRMVALRDEGVRVTPTHVVARVCAELLARHPDVNVTLRGHRVWQRETIDVFLQVAVPGTGDVGSTELSGVKIEHADRFSLRELAVEVGTRVEKARTGTDQSLNRSRAGMAAVPRWLLGPVLRSARYLMVDLNLDLTRLGVARDPFGSIAVTNVGSLGVDTAFAPLYPIGGPPIQLTVGAIKERPVVENGEVVARPTIRIAGAFDHRVVDGFHLAVLARELRSLLEDELDEL